MNSPGHDMTWGQWVALAILLGAACGTGLGLAMFALDARHNKAQRDAAFWRTEIQRHADSMLDQRLSIAQAHEAEQRLGMSWTGQSAAEEAAYARSIYGVESNVNNSPWLATIRADEAVQPAPMSPVIAGIIGFWGGFCLVGLLWLLALLRHA